MPLRLGRRLGKARSRDLPRVRRQRDADQLHFPRRRSAASAGRLSTREWTLEPSARIITCRPKKRCPTTSGEQGQNEVKTKSYSAAQQAGEQAQNMAKPKSRSAVQQASGQGQNEASNLHFRTACCGRQVCWYDVLLFCCSARISPSELKLPLVEWIVWLEFPPPLAWRSRKIPRVRIETGRRSLRRYRLGIALRGAQGFAVVDRSPGRLSRGHNLLYVSLVAVAVAESEAALRVAVAVVEEIPLVLDRELVQELTERLFRAQTPHRQSRAVEALAAIQGVPSKIFHTVSTKL